MSKQLKRKITVNLTSKNKTLPKTRPSVFERLGTKANSTNKEYCHHWAQSGSCPYGKGCKYSATHTLISPSKQRAAKTQSVPKRHHAKDAHKRLRTGEPDDWDQWDPDELEDADPDDLEKRRQELQRELELQMKMESKARKKDKKVKKESSPSSDSSSSSSESSTSSDESSSTSSTSVESRRKKVKKTKSKRASSSSSDERGRKHKSKNKKLSKSIVRDKSKKSLKPIVKVSAKSPSPVRIRKKSETPPLKVKQLAPSKKSNSETKSPRPLSRLSDRKEKHRTPSPKPSKDKEREKEREKEKERDREKEKEREKEREREREKEKEREREKEKERERERAKERAKEREREKDKDYKKKESTTRSPKRDSRTIRDNKKRETPDSSHSRDRKSSPSRSKGGGSSSSRRDHKSPPPKDDRRSDKRDDRARSRGKDRPADKNRKEKRDSRDRDRERERERERRIAREEKEAAREKERAEALARCQERQRERERLKELAKKEEERRARDRNRRDDRGLDKSTADRVERLIPLSEDRLPPCRKAHSIERDRNDRRDRDRHDRTPDSRSTSRKSPDRHDRLDRDLDKDRVYDRNYDRSTDRPYDRDRDHERDRDYSSLPPRIRENDRRLDDKDYDSPYDRSRHEDRRYLDIDEHYNENSRDDRIPVDGRDYPDDRRTRRELWDMREDRGELEREREIDHRSRYGREDSRPPGSIKSREWDPEYSEHEWDRNRRPLDWENRENWDNLEHKHSTEEEWRHYNRSLDSWPADDRRRWPGDWRERSRPRSSTSHHNMDVSNDDSNIESRRKEPPPSLIRLEQPSDPKIPPVEVEVKKEIPIVTPKRPAEEPLESVPETKKICVKQEVPPVLEDDLSEISDDADEILNRDEEIAEMQAEEQATQPDTTDTTSLKDQNTSTASQKSQSPPRSPNKTLQKEESIDEENMDLDFEEISEDELEEESRVKGLGDALGVDWASLVAEFRPRTKPMSSAKLRWESHNVLVNLGVSVRLAGEDLVRDILKEHADAKMQEHLKEERDNKDVKVNIKTEPQEVNVNGIKQEIKEEPMDIKEEIEDIKEDFQMDPDDVIISHPIAAIQVANREKQAVRKTLFTSVGSHRRALSARRDLVVRRHLCNLPINDMYVEAPKRHDPELLKIATQLFERCL